LDKDTLKIRIYDIAKEYKISSDALLKVLRGLGFSVRSHMSVASEDMLDAIADKFKHEIEEVKKDDEVRRKKLMELEAKKRREDAEINALKRKTEAKAKRKTDLAEKEAKAKAAKEPKKKLEYRPLLLSNIASGRLKNRKPNIGPQLSKRLQFSGKSASQLLRNMCIGRSPNRRNRRLVRQTTIKLQRRRPGFA